MAEHPPHMQVVPLYVQQLISLPLSAPAVFEGKDFDAWSLHIKDQLIVQCYYT
jgi:hypothetical protein